MDEYTNLKDTVLREAEAMSVSMLDVAVGKDSAHLC